MGWDLSDSIFLKHKQVYAEARVFNGTLADAEDIKDWASGTDISWVPVDQNFTEPETESPDLSQGVSLDVMSPFGSQFAEAGDWIIKDDIGVRVMTKDQLPFYYSEESL